MKNTYLLLVSLFVLAGSLSFCHKKTESILTPPDPDEELVPPPPPDPMDLFTGVYTGLKICGQSNSSASISVNRNPAKADHLMIGDQSVYIDLTCNCYPNLNLNGYRIYHAWFRNDSLFLNLDPGTLNQPQLCKYYLKKQ